MVSKKQLKKTMNTTLGIIGLSVGSSIGSTIPGTAGQIVTGGVLPVAGLGLLANQLPKTKKKKKYY